MSKISRKHKWTCLHTCVCVWFSWRPFSLNYMLCVHLGVHCCQTETLHQSDMKVFVSAQLVTPAVCRVNRDPLTPRTCLEMSFKQGLQPLCAGRCFAFRSSLQENRKTLQHSNWKVLFSLNPKGAIVHLDSSSCGTLAECTFWQGGVHSYQQCSAHSRRINTTVDKAIC